MQQSSGPVRLRYAGPVLQLPSPLMSDGPFLLVVSHDDKSETHAFHKDVVTIGRSRECDLFLPDRLISRIHCRVERQDGLFVLVDAGAQNPAKMHGRPVMRAEIKVGDTFAVGAYEITLSVPQTENASVDETRASGDGGRGAQDLVTFLQIARALNEEKDLARLLTQIVDAGIQISGAERGFLLLGQGDEHSVEVARNFAQEEVRSPECKSSRTLATRHSHALRARRRRRTSRSASGTRRTSGTSGRCAAARRRRSRAPRRPTSPSCTRARTARSTARPRRPSCARRASRRRGSR